MAVSAEEIVGFVRKRRFPLGSEKALQSAMEKAFASAGYTFAREHKLNASDIPDFFFDDEDEGLAVEVKIKTGASKRDIHAQCERYCAHDSVKTLVLVTNVAMGFPPEINGKPCYVASLGMGWL